ncbi:cobalamin adenosyltransferase [Deltaproteobacteria bacterium Smac51]|nr:cobalamin adenosyltransferase [Deltaproteobacteria bacterium Smac51]
MKPLTELDLRMALKDSDARTYSVPRGTVITPSAVEYLKMRQVELVFQDAKQSPAKTPSSGFHPGSVNGDAFSRPAPKPETTASQKTERPAPRWDFSDPAARNCASEVEKPKELFFGPDGGQFDHKPESLTHLKGRQLVHKDHPVIIFRGKLDTLTARIIEAQVCGHQLGNQEYVKDLQEVLEFTRRLLTYELRGKEVEDFYLLGLDAAALRERSHDPVKFFGHRHMLADYRMGPLCIALNTLRAMVREVELAAATAFKDGSGQPTRDDIIRALNRLSSLLYIMMFKYLPPDFEPEHSGI